MTETADEFDLGGLRLRGARKRGQRIELGVRIDPLVLGGERWGSSRREVPVKLEVSRMTGSGTRCDCALRPRSMARACVA